MFARSGHILGAYGTTTAIASYINDGASFHNTDP